MDRRGTYDGAGKVLTKTVVANETVKTLGYTAGVSYSPTTTGKIEYTLGNALDLAAGNVVWHPWSLGTISSPQAAVFPGPISGIRVSAPGILTVRIHKCHQ